LYWKRPEGQKSMSRDSEVNKGKKVMITMTNGEIIVTKFIDTKSNRIITEAGSFNKKNIANLVTYKHNKGLNIQF
jgi:hypothetical protein